MYCVSKLRPFLGLARLKKGKFFAKSILLKNK